MADDPAAEIGFLTFQDICKIHDRGLLAFGEGAPGFVDQHVVRAASGQARAPACLVDDKKVLVELQTWIKEHLVPVIYAPGIGGAIRSSDLYSRLSAKRPTLRSSRCDIMPQPRIIKS